MDLALIFEDDQEDDIDQIMSDANTYENNQGMAQILDDVPILLLPLLDLAHPEEEILPWDKNFERARQNNVRNRKWRRVRDLLTSLNRLSASLFAAISVTERQIAVLQDLHTLFLTKGQAKTKAREGGHPLRQNPSLKDIAPTPILSENHEQLWSGNLVTIDRALRERKSFIQKIKVLVENMGTRRETV